MTSVIVLLLKPAFYWPPDGRPLESDRVIHPSGFSIIKPRGGWGHKFHHALDFGLPLGRMAPTDGLSLGPENTMARLHDMMMITRVAADFECNAEPTNDNRLTMPATTFAGQSGKYRVWTAVIPSTDGSSAYALCLSIPNRPDARVPDYWWPYLNSFREVQ